MSSSDHPGGRRRQPATRGELPRWRAAIAALAWAALVAAPAAAGLAAGGVVGLVVDVDGRHLPGVAIVLTPAAGEPIALESDAEGRFAARELAPGNYSLVAEHGAFHRAVYEPVTVRIGRLTSVRIQMSETVEETLVVTTEPPPAGPAAAAPLLRLEGELPRVAVADDPWQGLREAAGVVVAAGPVRRGEASARGASPKDNVYLVDGVEVAAGDATPAYFDLGAGRGVELRVGDTAGAALELVTRPTEVAGRRLAVRSTFTDRNLQAGDDSPTTSRIHRVVDLSADAATALVAERLWAWGTVGLQQVGRQAVGGQLEEGTSEHFGGRLDARLGPATQAAVSFHYGERDVEGSGAGLDRTLETTLRELTPSRVASADVSRLFAGMQLTLRGSRVASDSLLEPRGGDDADIVLAADGAWHGSFGAFRNGHETDSWETVLEADAGSHVDQEIELGYRRRDSHVTSSERWGSDGLVHLAGENFGTPYDLVRLTRPTDLAVDVTGNHFWLSDTLRWGRLTVTGGVRHDIERGQDAGAGATANPLFPDLLPASDERGDRLEWLSLAPRLSLAWAPGSEGRTVVRAGYASYAARMPAELVERTHPGLAAALVAYEDLDEDGRFSAAETRFVLDTVGLAPGARPTARAANDVDPERSDERILAVEHRRGTWLAALEHVDRTTSRVLEVHPTVRDGTGVRRAAAGDYRLVDVASGLLPDGSPYAVPIYELAPGVEATGEWLFENGDRSQRYAATTLRLERAMRAGWAVRGHVTWSDWRWHLGDDFLGRDDPTNLAPTGAGPADDDGAVVAPVSSDGRLLLNSRWSFDLVATRQVARQRAWGFDLGLAVHGREGFPLAYSATVVDSRLGVRHVQATPEVDTYRLDDLMTVDLRLAKELRWGALRATATVDVFNLLDADTVLERETSLTSPQAGLARETQSPRVVRLGLRLGLD